MKSISCAVCQSQNYKVKYPEYIDYSNIDFSARRPPTKNHFRIVQCNECGLIYSSPIFPDDEIIELYRKSKFISEIQADNMSEDYLDQLIKASTFFEERENLLEIGCGNGSFLKKANEFGFKNVYGVEPGIDAVNKAEPEIKKNITNSTFQDGLFEENFFDLVCVIQTFDHLLDPNDVLNNITKVLRKKGYIFIVSHDIRAFMPSVLGKRSPMYDIEHIYLFDKNTICKLLKNHKFKILYVNNIPSRYTVEHGIKFFPLPSTIENNLINIARKLNILKKTIKFFGGNMVLLAQKD